MIGPAIPHMFNFNFIYLIIFILLNSQPTFAAVSSISYETVDGRIVLLHPEGDLQTVKLPATDHIRKLLVGKLHHERADSLIRFFVRSSISI